MMLSLERPELRLCGPTKARSVQYLLQMLLGRLHRHYGGSDRDTLHLIRDCERLRKKYELRCGNPRKIQHPSPTALDRRDDRDGQTSGQASTTAEPTPPHPGHHAVPTSGLFGFAPTEQPSARRSLFSSAQGHGAVTKRPRSAPHDSVAKHGTPEADKKKRRVTPPVDRALAEGTGTPPSVARATVCHHLPRVAAGRPHQARGDGHELFGDVDYAALPSLTAASVGSTTVTGPCKPTRAAAPASGATHRSQVTARAVDSSPTQRTHGPCAATQADDRGSPGNARPHGSTLRAAPEVRGSYTATSGVTSHQLVTVRMLTVTEHRDPRTGNVRVLRKDEQWKQWSLARNSTGSLLDDQGCNGPGEAHAHSCCPPMSLSPSFVRAVTRNRRVYDPASDGGLDAHCFGRPAKAHL